MVNPKTVLIVAPPSLIQRVFREMLNEHGYDVLYERSGYSSLAIGQDNAGIIDLSVVDWNYRGPRGGVSLAHSLQELSPDMSTLFYACNDGRLVLIPDPAEGLSGEEFTPATFLSYVGHLTIPAYYDLFH